MKGRKERGYGDREARREGNKQETGTVDGKGVRLAEIEGEKRERRGRKEMDMREGREKKRR